MTITVNFYFQLLVVIGQGSNEEELALAPHEMSKSSCQSLSFLSDEGLDLTQRISESLFLGPETEADEELVTGREILSLMLLTFKLVVLN